MITEVLGLGIKGQDLVLSTLKKIQKQKDQFKQPVKTAFNLAGMAKAAMSVAGGIGKQPPPGSAEESDKLARQQEKENERQKYSWDTAKNDIKTGIGAVGGMDTKALITGLGHSLDVWTVGISGILAEMGGAAITFKDKIRQSASLVADTAALDQSINKFGAGDFLRNRSDTTAAERGGIADAIRSSMGKSTDVFKNALEKLYTGPGGKAYDVRETTALAQGNYSELGTDTGFFMQQISDSLRGLPPSIRQAVNAQLLERVPESERAEQTDRGMRNIQAEFNRRDRDTAAAIASPANIQSALKIDAIQRSIDVGLAGSIDTLSKALTKAAETIKKNITDSQTMNPEKQSKGGMLRAIQ